MGNGVITCKVKKIVTVHLGLEIDSAESNLFGCLQKFSIFQELKDHGLGHIPEKMKVGSDITLGVNFYNVDINGYAIPQKNAFNFLSEYGLLPGEQGRR
jgi:hypothetical protein